MHKKTYFWMLVCVLVFALGLSACGGGGGAEEGDDAVKAGKELFEQTVIGASPGCVTCHSLEPDVTIVGPSLAVIGTEAAEEVEGMSAEDFLQESIVDPDAFIAPGFTAGVMPKTWGEELTAEQIDNLVANLLTLK